MPMITSNASAHNATISERILPDMKKTIVNINVARVPIASRFSVMRVYIYAVLYIMVAKLAK